MPRKPSERKSDKCPSRINLNPFAAQIGNSRSMNADHAALSDNKGS